MQTLARVTSLHIPLKTVFTVALGLALLWAAWKLHFFLGLFALALLGALTLAPAMRWLERRKVPHFAAVLCLALALGGAGFGLWQLIVPPLTDQLGQFGQTFEQAQQRLERHPTRSQLLQRMVREAREFPKSDEGKALLQKRWSYGYMALEAVTSVLIVLVLMLYLLLDGKRLYAWLLSYVPRAHRRKVGVTAEEVGVVVRAYVRGQLITSAAAGLCMYVALTVLGVPAAVPLALFAALMDVLPVLGIIATAAPAALIALAVSPSAAVAIIVVLLAYHAVENYLLIPWVYGKQLRLSTLSVLLAFLAGGILAGAFGAVLALPIVAAYPIIERHWLAGYLADETVEEHARMDSKSEEQVKRAIDEVAADANVRQH